MGAQIPRETKQQLHFQVKEFDSGIGPRQKGGARGDARSIRRLLRRDGFVPHLLEKEGEKGQVSGQ